MNMQHKQGVFEEKCEEYWRARKKRKSVILSSLVEVTGLTRKTCIKRMRFLQLRDPTSTEQRGRPRYYTNEVIAALLEVWEIGSESCGENLHPQIGEYLDIQIREKEWKHDELATCKLRKMSLGSVKHYVGNFTRTRRNFGGKGTTHKSSVISMVPIRMDGWDTAETGVTQVDTVAHCDDSTEGDYVNSITFTELYSGWTENRAVWNKSADSVLAQLKELEQVVPFAMKDFHTDNGGEFLNWALYRHLTGRPAKVPWTRSRAYRKNDNAHCEQKNWTHVRQLFGHDRFGHAELAPLMNDLYANEWSQFTNHFKPAFKLWKREKKNGRTKRIYEKTPQTPYQRLLDSAAIPEATKVRLRVEHEGLDPFALKKSIEEKLKKFFTALGNLDRESTKT